MENEQPPKTDRAPRRWREPVLALVSMTLTLLLVEVGFRLYLAHRETADLERVRAEAQTVRVDTCRLGEIVRFSPEKDLFYELKPGVRGRYCGGAFSVNAAGMRMPVVPELSKPEHVLRVVAVGDSYLFGQGVDDGKGFLEVLQARAIEKGLPEEMLNFGVPGYNTWMEGVVLRTKARHYAPDAVVVAVTGNDWDLPSFMLSRPYGDLAHSFVLGALAERFRAPPRLLETPRSKVYEGHYLAVPEEVPPQYRHMVGFEGYRRALADILSVTASAGAKVVLFSDCLAADGPGTTSCTFPFAPGQYERLKHDVFDDPRVVLCPWELTQDELIPRDGHPNERGHAHLADQLAPCLEKAGIPSP